VKAGGPVGVGVGVGSAAVGTFPFPQTPEKRERQLDSSSDYYWEQDEHGRFTLVQHFGPVAHGGHPIIGKTFSETGAELVHGTWKDHRHIRDAREPFLDLIAIRRTGQGHPQYQSLSGLPVFDRDGGFRGYRGIVRGLDDGMRRQRLLWLERHVNHVLADAEVAERAFTDLIRGICESEGWSAGRYWHVGETGELEIRGSWTGPETPTDAHTRAIARPSWDEALVREVSRTKEPLWISDLASDPRVAGTRETLSAECRSAFLYPILFKSALMGVLDFNGLQIPEPDAPLLELVWALGIQIGHFFERAAAAARLRESEERFATTVERAAIGIAHVGLDGRFLHANPVLCRMLGYTRDELLKLSVRQISHADDASVTDDDVARLATGQIESFKAEKRYLRKDGTPIWVRLTIAANRDADGRILHHVSIVEDISDRRQAESRIQYLAAHDEMTGLLNRATFNQLLAHAIEQSRRHERRLAVLFIDLDRFKIVNDSLGHEAGDELLKVMATRIERCLRTSDVVARVGGDEFVVLVENLNDRQGAETVARNLLSAVIKPVGILGYDCRVTASIGIAIFPDDASDGKDLMKHADLAMYEAKDHGKNAFRFFSPGLNALSTERLAVETHLRAALEREELFLHYQAKVSAGTGEIKGVEALLRWSNPELGLVPPNRFIPVAEECGLIMPIGRWVIRTACAQNAAWLRAGLPPVCIAVNLSPRQFTDPKLSAHIVEALEDAGLPPELLELEITESMVMHDIEQAVRKLSDIKALGVRLALDDFGTGYSSLSQLKRFPIDTLKVDRSFIRDIPGDAEGGAITEAIIALGKSLGVTVVAEGVETFEQQRFLSQRACDELQGFYFSRPSHANAVAALLRDGTVAPERLDRLAG
jgi:diguanylate cyclase (GGDEF)-like protein/PAS domain S-box-containing protein